MELACATSGSISCRLCLCFGWDGICLPIKFCFCELQIRVVVDFI